MDNQLNADKRRFALSRSLIDFRQSVIRRRTLIKAAAFDVCLSDQCVLLAQNANQHIITLKKRFWANANALGCLLGFWSEIPENGGPVLNDPGMFWTEKHTISIDVFLCRINSMFVI